MTVTANPIGPSYEQISGKDITQFSYLLKWKLSKGISHWSQLTADFGQMQLSVLLLRLGSSCLPCLLGWNPSLSNFNSK